MRLYDRLGEREWGRHDANWSAKFAYQIHRHYLQRFVHPGDLILARIGARIHVSDVSPRQLELNVERVATAGCAPAVVARTLLDICDLSAVAPNSVDAVVCYGGALSYAMDRADEAVREMLGVTRPGGHVLIGVISLLGTLRAFLPGVVAVGRTVGAHRNDEIVATGDLPRHINGHQCHMFRWSELSVLLSRYGEIVAASATNFLSIQNEQAIEAATDDQRAQALKWELELCCKPGALDAGTHILAVVRKRLFSIS